MPYPCALDERPKIMFFTDFDGTITREDGLDLLVETEGYGPEKLKLSNQDTVDGKISFRAIMNNFADSGLRQGTQDQLDSIKTPFNKCIKTALENTKVDEHFASFFEWAASVSMPVMVLSGGLTPIIHATLEEAVGPAAKDIVIVANEVVPRDGFKSIDEKGSWRIEFNDGSVHGNDKASNIRPYARYRDKSEDRKPILIYVGDGISDFSAARETDLLFAKEGSDLAVYCDKENIPFVPFRDWKTILKTTKEIYDGTITVEQIVGSRDS